MNLNYESYSTSVLIKIPVRPDNDEAVAPNGKTEETSHPGSMFGVDHVSNYVDPIKDETDHSDNDPGQQQVRSLLKKNIRKVSTNTSKTHLPCSMDEKRSNDDVANAEDKEDRHYCGCNCGTLR